MVKKVTSGSIYYPTKEAQIRIQTKLKRDFGSVSRGLYFLGNAYVNKDFLKDAISLAELKEREYERNNHFKNGGIAK